MSNVRSVSRVSPTTVDATADDALGTDDLTALLDRLARRDVSPAELRTAALSRARAVNGRLNAVAAWADQPVVTEVPVDDDAPFAGIPTLVKDNEDLTGFVTTQGSWAMPERAASSCSPWVAQYLSLGVGPIAKTTLPEFGLTASTESTRFGATRNPWDTTRSAGGSSGGSAALVAAGVVPIAHANDGGGSIRIPAACCGLVGLKPSRGRLVDWPMLQRMPVPITVQGVLTRSVRDTARYVAEAERRYRAPSLPKVGHVVGPDRTRLRVGLVRNSIPGLPVTAAALAAVDTAARLCADLGHDVDEAPPPVGSDFGRDFLRYWAFLAFTLKNAGRRLYGEGFDGSRTETLTRELSRLFVTWAELLPASLRRLRRLAADADHLHSEYDVLLSPVTGHPAPPLGHLGPDVDPHVQLVRLLRFTSFTPLQNVTGAPAIALPIGRTAEALPVGVQLSAPVGAEARLLSLAYELEAAAPWPLTPGAAER